jgi:hypothetical protein
LPLPLRPVAEISLPGDNSRFDYASLDAQRGLLFVALLGASEVVEIDAGAGRAVRTMPNLSHVHGVLVVGTLRRVYATATGKNQVVDRREHRRRDRTGADWRISRWLGLRPAAQHDLDHE